MLRTITAPLGERTRVLHIGTMKSGTNSIQHAARKKRPELLEHGVLYPGTGTNHFTPVAAFMGVSQEGKVPSIHRWERLMAEVNDFPDHRILLSHEWICESDDELAERFVEAVGEPIHVVVTLRSLAGMLGSYWQQMVKTGVATLDFNEWLTRVLADPPGTRRKSKFDLQSDQAGIVRRWERIVGPDRITVIVADKKDPELISASFEKLLNLPKGFLWDTGADGGQSNRSLSLPEAELFRRLNVVFKKHEIPWVEYATAFRRGAVARVLHKELPGSDQKIQLPEWAAEVATDYARDIVSELSTSKARVVGDLSTLYAPVPSVPELPADIPMIPMDVAVEAIVGSFSASTGRGPFFGPQKKRKATGSDLLLEKSDTEGKGRDNTE